MKLIPQQYYLLIELRDIKADGKILRPDGSRPQAFPHGEVIAKGPDCKFTEVGDLIVFNLGNVIGFENLNQYIIPEGAVFAKAEIDNVVPLTKLEV